MDVPTLDDIDVGGKTVGVRVDVNSPMTGGRLDDDARLRAHVDTLGELADRGATVAVLAHQGRPGSDDFEPLAAHADRLDALLEAPVDYVDATFSSAARERLAATDPGAVLVLENTRFFSEEYMEFDPAEAATSHLVAKLAPSLDAFVGDAFATAHRSQPSIVGFPHLLPAHAGRVMEREIEVLGAVEETPEPRVYVLGGAKVPDSLDVAESVLGRDLADAVLTCGVVGNVFLLADGVDLGDATAEFIYQEGYWDEIDRARNLLDAYDERIHQPLDVAVARDGERHEHSLMLPFEAGDAAIDVGGKTVDHYGDVIADAGTVILNGPAGVVEREGFTRGTRGIYEAASTADYSIVGGGDTAAAIRNLGIEGFDHVSTGGGACLRMLTGDPLPGVEVLRE